jgi:hypothetical protein
VHKSGQTGALCQVVKSNGTQKSSHSSCKHTGNQPANNEDHQKTNDPRDSCQEHSQRSRQGSHDCRTPISNYTTIHFSFSFLKIESIDLDRNISGFD